MLNESEIETYHRDGYVIPKGFRFDEEELAGLQVGLGAVLAGNPDIMPLLNHLDQLTNRLRPATIP